MLPKGPNSLSLCAAQVVVAVEHYRDWAAAGYCTTGFCGYCVRELVGPAREDYPISIPLMQHANLPQKVFESAVVLAQQSQEGPNIEVSMTLWQLALIRFESDAVGEDWGSGAWDSALRWQLTSTHNLP